MKLAFKKEYEDKRTYHKCHVCVDTDVWGENWRWQYIPIGKGYSGYEIQFNTCSDECREKCEKDKMIKKIQTRKISILK